MKFNKQQKLKELKTRQEETKEVLMTLMAKHENLMVKKNSKS